MQLLVHSSLHLRICSRRRALETGRTDLRGTLIHLLYILILSILNSLLRLTCSDFLHRQLARLPCGRKSTGTRNHWPSGLGSSCLLLRVAGVVSCSHNLLALTRRDNLQLLLALFGIHGCANTVTHALPDDLLGNDLERLHLQRGVLALEAGSCRRGHAARRRHSLRWKWVALSLLLNMKIVSVSLAQRRRDQLRLAQEFHVRGSHVAWGASNLLALGRHLQLVHHQGRAVLLLRTLVNQIPLVLQVDSREIGALDNLSLIVQIV